MALGIDPKNDYAFKRVFGSEHHTSILIHLLNAVLGPPPDRRIAQVDIRNPITEPVVLDDKLSILDVKACDQRGRLFNIEMQMVLHPSLPSRLLYYWAKTYSSQLVAGDKYNLLAPTISICFLDGLLFPESDAYHLPFKLTNEQLQLVFSEDQEIHIVQLPNFVKGESDLSGPIDTWLYFLNNGEKIEPDALSPALQFPEFEEALDILRTLTQDEIERERYEAREKARRDALSWQHAIQQAKEDLERAQQEAERAQQEAERAQQEAERAQQEAEQLRQQAAEGHSRGFMAGLIGQIRLCETLLQQAALTDEQLQGMTLEELQRLVDQLRDRLTSHS